jgi:histidinol dehydrogenase
VPGASKVHTKRVSAYKHPMTSLAETAEVLICVRVRVRACGWVGVYVDAYVYTYMSKLHMKTISRVLAASKEQAQIKTQTKKRRV